MLKKGLKIIGMNIVIADHQVRVRFALRILLERMLGLSVIGEAASVQEMMHIIEAACPDVLLVDWELPDLSTSQLVPELQQLCPNLMVIAVSSRPEVRQAALEAGVQSFIDKSAPPEALLAAVAACRRETAGDPASNPKKLSDRSPAK